MVIALRNLFCLFTLIFTPLCIASESSLNIYAWSEEIPPSIIHQFENETGIKVNYSTYDSNEMMFSKIRAAQNNAYDIVEPSSYYIDRMRHLNMLKKLDRQRLANFRYLDPQFLHNNYDPNNQFSIPFIWGITGIFVNTDYYRPEIATTWHDLLNKRYLNQLMFLDDPREVFSMAMRLLGYSINDNDPAHIKQAYLLLKDFLPNIKLFNTDATISILIDEDATIGMVWNGDLYKASLENPKLRFVYPSDGFEIWIDNFAILKNAPHEENAYQFLNFILRPDIAARISLAIHYSTANLAGRKLLPANIRNDPALYPSAEVLQRGEVECDIGDQAFNLYEKYWERLKIGV